MLRQKQPDLYQFMFTYLWATRLKAIDINQTVNTIESSSFFFSFFLKNIYVAYHFVETQIKRVHIQCVEKGLDSTLEDQDHTETQRTRKPEKKPIEAMLGYIILKIDIHYTDIYYRFNQPFIYFLQIYKFYPLIPIPRNCSCQFLLTF